MRYQRFRYRHTRLTSLAQVNQALEECVKRINDWRYTRFGVSRRERFEALEKAALKPLPKAEFDGGEWKDAMLHADCYVSVEGDYYSALHRTESRIAFLTDVTKLKDDLILFRRGDVQHSKWYCRMKVPGVDRYKTVALKIESLREAQDKAFEHYADLRFRLKHYVPMFGKTFEEVALKYSDELKTGIELGRIRSEVIADPVIADAIRDRLQHSALTINISGESYRGVKARKLASKKKDA